MKITFLYIKHLAIPVTLLLLGLLLSEFIKNLDDIARLSFTYLPYLFFGVGAWLCIQFNQSRMLFSLLSFFIIYSILHNLHFSILRLYEFILMFWALLNVALLSQMTERSVFSRHSLIKLSVFIIQGALTWYCLVYQFLFTEMIFYTTFLTAPPEWLNISWLLIAASLLSLLVVTLRFVFQPNPISAGHLVLILLLISLLNSDGSMYLFLTLSLSAGAIMFIAVQIDSHTMAYRDELTGLRSRRALNQYVTGLGKKYTIAMIDIDHFKKFNDNHGHDVGDQMLKLVASRIAKIRGGGTPFRYGGEEFTVIFPRKTMEQASPYLETLRGTIENYPLIIRASDRPKEKNKKSTKNFFNSTSTKQVKTEALSSTISIGIAHRNEESKKPEQVIKLADKALYRAKKKGRNCLSH